MSRDDFDASSLLGDQRPGPQRPKRQQKRYGDTLAKAPIPKATRPKVDAGIYDHLAMKFRDTDVYIPQGATLIAALLRRRVESDPVVSLKIDGSGPRDEAVIQDVVEYMIRRFWATVPNDERANALNAFLKDEWWAALAEESIDHQRTLRVMNAPMSPGGPDLLDDPSYAHFILPEKPRPEGTLRERFEAARHRHHQESD